jgi:transcriptional regulator with XRE-family HTH domain
MFGANLRVLAKQYPSISELSRQLGINRTQFNRYLSGESFPRPDVLDRICSFFDVDARILLEPVETLANKGQVLSGPVLSEFAGKAVANLPEEIFPSGFYRFSRRSFVNDEKFVIGLALVFRDGDCAYVKGFEAKAAMRQQGLPEDARYREFRGYISRQEDGVAMIISRRKGITSTYNYLARVASFENNFWVGYVSRPVRESLNSSRATRMVYEHNGRDREKVMHTARNAGLVPESSLLPFHHRLLQVGDDFR